jgi:uncharacterized RDD family membrane protein YckC
MRLSLFDALRVPEGSNETIVRAALRRVVRRLYGSTRDLSGDVEEGLRFCNAASSVLLDKVERDHYDGEYANLLSGGTDIRRSHAATDGHSTRRAHGTVVDPPASASGTTSLRPGLVSLLEIAGGTPNSLNSAWLMLGLAFAFAVGVVFFSLGLPTLQVLQYAVLFLGIAAAAGAAGVALQRTNEGRAAPEQGPTLRDLPVIKWRRERSVFMGSRLKQEEAAWVYRLRVAETDRGRQSRNARPAVAFRLLARLLDYGLWGATIYALLALLNLLGFNNAFVLTAWWAFPLIIVLTWIPIEAWLIYTFRQTPGKWLFGLRCRPGMTSVSAPDQIHESPRYALLRALGVAGIGSGFGLPLLSLFTPFSGLKARTSEYETRWDALGDSIITQVPLRSKQAGFAAATLALLAAGYTTAWWPSFRQTSAIISEARQLAPQVSWGALARANPKSWVPAEMLDPSAWAAGAKNAIPEELAALKSTIQASVTTKSAAPGAPSAATAAQIDDRARWAAYEDQATRAMSGGNPAAALDMCQKWTKEEPANPTAWKCYGLGLQIKGRHAEAIQAMRRAQRIEPSDRSMDGPLRISFFAIKGN